MQRRWVLAGLGGMIGGFGGAATGVAAEVFEVTDERGRLARASVARGLCGAA